MNGVWKTSTELLLEKAVAWDAEHLEQPWTFHCRLGLAQSTCGRFERDPESPGAQRGYGGCAACEYRAAATQATREMQ